MNKKIFIKLMIPLIMSGLNLIFYAVFNFEIAILIALGFLYGSIINNLGAIKDKIK